MMGLVGHCDAFLGQTLYDEHALLYVKLSIVLWYWFATEVSTRVPCFRNGFCIPFSTPDQNDVRQSEQKRTSILSAYSLIQALAATRPRSTRLACRHPCACVNAARRAEC
jgi:hypothetical protein